MPEPATHETDEVAELKERVVQLERELAERTERAHAAVAAAQERVYWLDRWRVDLNAVMERPLAQRVYAAVFQARRALGFARRLLRRLAR